MCVCVPPQVTPPSTSGLDSPDDRYRDAGIQNTGIHRNCAWTAVTFHVRLDHLQCHLCPSAGPSGILQDAKSPRNDSQIDSRGSCQFGMQCPNPLFAMQTIHIGRCEGLVVWSCQHMCFPASPTKKRGSSGSRRMSCVIGVEFDRPSTIPTHPPPIHPTPPRSAVPITHNDRSHNAAKPQGPCKSVQRALHGKPHRSSPLAGVRIMYVLYLSISIPPPSKQAASPQYSDGLESQL